MPTIKDVAKHAGVSIATVSYVLNNKTTYVSEETRRLVQLSIEAVGYTPSITARNLQSHQTRLIGYAWHPTMSGQMNPILDQFMYYLAQAAEEHDYHILTFTCPLNNPLHIYADLIKSKRVDAFVLAGTNYNDARIPFLQSQNFPFVSFGRANPEWHFPLVDTDSEQGGYEATQYLISLGHRRIAMVGWPQGSLSGDYRLNGYKRALQEAGISVPESYLYRGEQYESTGRKALTCWLDQSDVEPPTAVVAVTDLIALGVMNEAQSRGLTVGRELSVIGFDNMPLLEYFKPALTTFEQQIPKVGQILITMIKQMFELPHNESAHLLVPPRLIIRESCGAPIE
jgi:DNA-binding LacI/PurR family transcriptional regulator